MADIRPENQNFDIFVAKPTRWEVEKMDFFSISLKFAQNMFRYQILVWNESTVPQILISGHIMSFRTPSYTLNIFQFLQFFGQNHHFKHFFIFMIWCSILLEVAENIICALKCVLWVPKTLLDT